MRILIIGAGAIGSFIGGVLSNSGHDVTFLDLPAVVQRLETEGVRVEGLGSEIHAKNIHALTDVDTDSRYELAIVAVKSYSTRCVIEKLPEGIASRVLSFQNGLGNEEILAEKFGGSSVVAGSITYPVSYPEPGRVRIENPRAGMGIAPFEAGTDTSDIVEVLRGASLNVITCENYSSLKWSKLLLNIICNATCAILGMTPGEVFSRTDLVRIEREQVLEALQVMRMLKIPVINLPGYPVRLMTFLYRIAPPFLLKFLMQRRISRGRGEKKPSLLLDLERNVSVTEVGFLNGAVYRAGVNLSLPMRYNKIITETLEDIAHNSEARESIRGNAGGFAELFR